MRFSAFAWPERQPARAAADAISIRSRIGWSPAGRARGFLRGATTIARLRRDLRQRHLRGQTLGRDPESGLAPDFVESLDVIRSMTCIRSVPASRCRKLRESQIEAVQQAQRRASGSPEAAQFGTGQPKPAPRQFAFSSAVISASMCSSREPCSSSDRRGFRQRRSPAQPLRAVPRQIIAQRFEGLSRVDGRCLDDMLLRRRHRNRLFATAKLVAVTQKRAQLSAPPLYQYRKRRRSL